MHSHIDVADEGIVVVRTSTDPDVVAALHIHAADVSDMVDRGMEAVHEAMAPGVGNLCCEVRFKALKTLGSALLGQFCPHSKSGL